MAVGACSEGPKAPSAGTRLSIVESYEAADDARRSVTIEVTLVDEGDGVFGLADVSVRLVPAADGAVRKLEAVLDDAAIRVRPGAWPTAVRTLPAQALPALERIQLAITLLQPAGDPVDHPIVQLFDAPVTMGLTRVAREGGNATVRSVALASAADGVMVATGELTGSVTDHGAQLTGHRLLGTRRSHVTLSVERATATGAHAAVGSD